MNMLRLLSSRKSCSSLLFTRCFSKITYPVVEKFVLKEELTCLIFRSKIVAMRNRFFNTFRGIKHLDPMFSTPSFYQILFETDESDLFGLYSSSTNQPVSLMASDTVLVINEELWKFVCKEYKLGKTLKFKPYIFSAYHLSKLAPSGFSFFMIQQSINVVATMEEYGGNLLLTDALSVLILFTSYSTFFSEICGYFEYLVYDKQCEIEFESYLIGLVKQWPNLSQQVFDGKTEFLIDGFQMNIRNIRETVCLIACKEKTPGLFLDVGSVGLIDVINIRPWNRFRFNILVKIISNEIKIEKGEARSDSNLRLSHCLVADSTASVVFVARNEQVEMLVPGSVALLVHCRVEIYQEMTTLSLDKEYGQIIDEYAGEVKDPKVEPNLSDT